VMPLDVLGRTRATLTKSTSVFKEITLKKLFLDDP
jgi:hypothetical protein